MSKIKKHRWPTARINWPNYGTKMPSDFTLSVQGNWRRSDLFRRQAVGDEQRERTQSVWRLGDPGHSDRWRLGIRVGIFFVQGRRPGGQNFDSIRQAAEGHEKTVRRNVEVRKSHGPARYISICGCVEASLSIG